MQIYIDLDENDKILEEKKISKTNDNITIYDNNKSQIKIIFLNYVKAIC